MACWRRSHCDQFPIRHSVLRQSNSQAEISSGTSEINFDSHR